jgi:quinol monooxygenase YgiN
MAMTRRAFLILAGAALAAGPGGCASPLERKVMHGLIGKIKTIAGQRDALVAILLEGTSAMPGCLSYIVAKDPADAEALWVTEVWDSRASHEASLSLPSVQQAIAKGRPLIAGFGERFETQPVGGHGLAGA